MKKYLTAIGGSSPSQIQPWISRWTSCLRRHASALDPEVAGSLVLSQTCGLPLSSYDRDREGVISWAMAEESLKSSSSLKGTYDME